MLIGRESEKVRLKACIKASRNVLLEGPVGVGKTHLALAVLSELKKPCFRIDGDARYTEGKLSGFFDPAMILKSGYGAETFIAGPLTLAMQQGAVLFINELNRLPEGVQNILLPAIDEGLIQVPRLGEIKAKPGFCVIATQNPKEFVATSHLSEAVLDRFELVVIDYQSEAEEIEIVSERLQRFQGRKSDKLLPLAAVRLVRSTRGHERIKRGASVRAAIAIAELTSGLMSDGAYFETAFLTAALLALPTRMEIERDLDSKESLHVQAEILIKDWVKGILEDVQSGPKLKKK